MKLDTLTKLLFKSGKPKRETKKNKFEIKEDYFTKNGSILLEKQIALNQGPQIRVGQLKILSEDEIKRATNNYDPHLFVRSYRGLSFYKATFDDMAVGIKAATKPGSNPQLTNLLLTDVAIRNVLCHNNMIKIIGCCLDTYVPITVHEYYPSKALYEHLHGDMSPLTWTSRLRVATDIAYAICYMHNALSKPLVHRDIMSFGILLDTSFHAKLSFFGHSVAIIPGKKDTHTWPVHGTPGYIDPEYIETREVTVKCDVYSFGVLMLELLTSRDPSEMARRGNDLVDEFVSVVEKNGFETMMDMSLVEEGNMDEIRRFVRLALKCVSKKGEKRPNMVGVVKELWLMNDQGNNSSETKKPNTLTKTD